MLIYLASEYNQDRFSFLKEAYIMNTEVKARLNQDAFMKCIKKELRNLEISCLIIDLQIFDREEETIDFRQAIEAFSLLNPDCKIITMYDAEDDMSELITSIQQCPDIHVIDSNVSNAEIIDIINGVDVEQITASDAAADNIPDMNEEDETGGKVLKDKEYIEPSVELAEREILPSDNIYDKAVGPVKLSEGEPLKKRAKRIPEEKDGAGSETAKLSARVKRIQKYCGEMLPVQPTPAAPEDEGWSCSNIMIGMVGTERKSGTTTAAFHLAQYLRNQGAAVIYTEANLHGHLEEIAAGYNLTRVDDHYIFNEVLYYLDSQFDQNAGANFIIFDMGCIEENSQRTEKILKEFMNEVIIVSGCKPYEKEALDKALSVLNDKGLSILFNLSSQREMERLQKAYGSSGKCVADAPFEPELMIPGSWSDEFLELFLHYRTKHQAVS